MTTQNYKPTSVNATLVDLPTHRQEMDAAQSVAHLKEYFDAHAEAPGVLITDRGQYTSVVPRDVLYGKLSQAFGREIFLKRPVREFLEVWPQQPLACKSSCTIHQAVEQALSRPGTSSYHPIVVEYPDGSRALLEMHALLVAQSQVLALTRLVEEEREKAEAANRAKTEFLANISHELRTPLHGISSYARFGRDEALSGERNELLDYFSHVGQCADTLLGLVNDLLDLAKLEAGKMSFEPCPASLSDLVAVVTDEFNSICAERKIAILYLPPSGDTTACVDAERFKQVVRNLLSNAVKFTSPEGRVVVRLRPVGTCYLLSVCDEGPGIPADELQSIFDKFVQSSKTKSGSGGTGLGLAICQEIVLAHRGRIWAENNDVRGATFYCEIPRGNLDDADSCADDLALCERLP